MRFIECRNINKQDLKLDKDELARRLKSPRPFNEDVVCECVEKVLEVCRPRYCYAKTSVLHKGNGMVELELGVVRSVSLARALSGCSEAYVIALTLGIETDRLINTMSVTSGVRAFVFDAVSSALTEAAAEYVNAVLQKKADIKHRFSPGYSDFDLGYQKNLLSYLEADKLIGIKLGNNLMMTPRKSITAICGICDR